MARRIILVGPSAAGKNFIREKFVAKGFKPDISYTSRSPRENEVDGVDYYFISEMVFKQRIVDNLFYEWIKYGDNYYGTGLREWLDADIFIMETDGIKSIKPKDRPDCLVIYVNTPFDTRIQRMRERGWKADKIFERNKIDIKRFKDFKDYDLEISSEIHI